MGGILLCRTALASALGIGYLFVDRPERPGFIPNTGTASPYKSAVGSLYPGVKLYRGNGDHAATVMK